MTEVVNSVWLLAALTTASWMAASVGLDPKTLGPQVHGFREVAAPKELEDARGHRVQVGSYQRVVSIHPVADAVLLRLIEPERIVAVTPWSRHQHPEGWRFPSAVRAADRNDPPEHFLALKPDLVIASQYAEEDRLARIREAGIPVFDPGPMRGFSTLRSNIRTLAALLEQPARGAQLERELDRNLKGLEAALQQRARAPGIYLSVYGDVYFGGTADTSYADLLHYGGVEDLAALRGYRGWPRYGLEDLLALNPPLIVTQKGMRELICSHVQLANMTACGPGGRVVQLDGAYHSDAGLGLIEAAQTVLLAVHGEKTSQLPTQDGATDD